jgi:hypothetical protein
MPCVVPTEFVKVADDLRYCRIMNKATILVSALFGIFLGTSIGVAQASPDAPVNRDMSAPPAHVEVTENPITMSEVTIIGKRPVHHAVAGGHAKASTKTLVCTPFKDLEQGYGQVKTCEWK